jgi:two-component system CheB/CheR fusion protein
MGIGLALVRQLVELHDGRVEAFSAGEGKGARFTVWLPLEMMTESARRRQSPTAGPGQRLAGLRILVVDDSAANGEALRELLQFEGANVVMQAVPAEAIRHAEKQRFDVVISDIAMPELDGYAVLKAIRATKTNAQTPAIAYSGYSGRDEVERARSAGFDMYLTKPVDVDRLLDAVRTVAKPESAAD